MLVTDKIHWTNYQHNKKRRQHNDSVTNILNRSLIINHQYNVVTNITAPVQTYHSSPLQTSELEPWLRNWNQTSELELGFELYQNYRLLRQNSYLSLRKCFCWRLTTRRWILQSCWNENNQFDDLMNKLPIVIPFSSQVWRHLKFVRAAIMQFPNDCIF